MSVRALRTSSILPKPNLATSQSGLLCFSPRAQHTLRAPLISKQAFHSSFKAMSMEKVFSKDACPPAGPYSQAIKAAGQVFVSGQIPAGGDGKLVEGSITDITRQCCKNVEAILKEAGSSIDKVIRCGVYLDDMGNFTEMNAEYEKWFSHKPARTCVAVKTLPKNVKVEIECIALQ